MKHTVPIVTTKIGNKTLGAPIVAGNNTADTFIAEGEYDDALEEWTAVKYDQNGDPTEEAIQVDAVVDGSLPSNQGSANSASHVWLYLGPIDIREYTQLWLDLSPQYWDVCDPGLGQLIDNSGGLVPSMGDLVILYDHALPRLGIIRLTDPQNNEARCAGDISPNIILTESQIALWTSVASSVPENTTIDIIEDAP